MKLVHKDLKQGNVKLVIESSDDLWYLTQMLSPGDFVSGKTLRKIRVTEESEPVKKAVFLKIDVEKIEFQPSLLRVGGVIVEGPEDIPRGQHHTFNVESGTVLTVSKSHWFSYHLKNLEDSLRQKGAKFLICVFDREDAYFALTEPAGFKVLSRLKGSVAKKAVESNVKENFYQSIIKQLKEYDSRFQPFFIILASPAFWKEELLSHLKDDSLKKKMVQATCAGVDEKSINEVLKRDEVKNALGDERSRRELVLVEELLSEISKQGLAVYGIDDVNNAVLCGAVSSLLVSANFIKEQQELGVFQKINSLMEQVDRSRGEVHIISSDNDAGKQLDGLGGIAALLRFKIVG